MRIDVPTLQGKEYPCICALFSRDLLPISLHQLGPFLFFALKYICMYALQTLYLSAKMFCSTKSLSSLNNAKMIRLDGWSGRRIRVKAVAQT
jgi:hypothetical protein